MGPVVKDAIQRLRRNRYQLGMLIVANSYVFSALKFFPCPILNCYACPLAVFACPIGSLQHFVIIGAIPFFVLGLLGVIGAAVGKMTCGWLCPFGYLQDLLAKVPMRKFDIPRILEYGQYVALIILVLVLPVWLKEPWFSKLCPQGTLEAGIPWIFIDAKLRAQVGALYYVKLGILAGFLTAMLFTKRPFCRTACALGAIFSIFNRFSIFRLSVDTTDCDACGLCKSVCPVDLEVHKTPNDRRCIRCLQCTSCAAVTFGQSSQQT